MDAKRVKLPPGYTWRTRTWRGWLRWLLCVLRLRKPDVWISIKRKPVIVWGIDWGIEETK